MNESKQEIRYFGTTFKVGDMVVGTADSMYPGVGGKIVALQNLEWRPEAICHFRKPAHPSDLERVAKKQGVESDELQFENISVNLGHLIPAKTPLYQQTIWQVIVASITQRGNKTSYRTVLCSTQEEARAVFNAYIDICNDLLQEYANSTKIEISENRYEACCQDTDAITTNFRVDIFPRKVGLAKNVLQQIGDDCTKYNRYIDCMGRLANMCAQDYATEEEYAEFTACSPFDIQYLDVEQHLASMYSEEYYDAIDATLKNWLCQTREKSIQRQKE